MSYFIFAIRVLGLWLEMLLTRIIRDDYQYGKRDAGATAELPLVGNQVVRTRGVQIWTLVDEGQFDWESTSQLVCNVGLLVKQMRSKPKINQNPRHKSGPLPRLYRSPAALCCSYLFPRGRASL
jgi:hypothetical protein